MILYFLYALGHPGATFLIVCFGSGVISNIIWRNISRCEYCSSFFRLNWESSRTAYHWEGKGEDPNRNILLCNRCAQDHHEHWDGMWDDYRSSQY